MPEGQLHTWAAHEIADRVRSGDLKAVEVLDASLERIGRFDTELNSFVLLDPEGAYSAAERVDHQVAEGHDPGPLAGVPIGVKDLENAEGLPTQHGSLLFKGSVAMNDSTQVKRLKAAGAVVLGKTATPELGSAMYTSSKLSGVTRNPWDLTKTPGGSSGSSAAAVSAGLVPLATGSDGGGSIRIPASYCGLPGLKVTYGLVPRGPGRPGNSNATVYGPQARNVRDIARYLDQVVGSDPHDNHSLQHAGINYETSLDADLSGMKAVWSSTLGFGTCSREVAEIARTAADALFAHTGMEEVDHPILLKDPAAAWAVAEAMDIYADLEQFWPHRGEEMTGIVNIAMQLAESFTASQIADASRARYELLRTVNEFFDEVDLIVTPTTPTTAFEADGPMPTRIDETFLPNPLIAVCFTFPFNLTGHPAITIPAGVTAEGSPVGLQLVGKRLSEASLLSAARAFEMFQPWQTIAPDYV